MGLAKTQYPVINYGEIEEWTLDLNEELHLESAWVEVITASEEGKGAYIAEYATGLNGDELVRLHQSFGLRPELVNVNFDHAIVKALDQRFAGDFEGIGENLRELCDNMWSLYRGHNG